MTSTTQYVDYVGDIREQAIAIARQVIKNRVHRNVNETRTARYTRYVYMNNLEPWGSMRLQYADRRPTRRLERAIRRLPKFMDTHVVIAKYPERVQEFLDAYEQVRAIAGRNTDTQDLYSTPRMDKRVAIECLRYVGLYRHDTYKILLLTNGYEHCSRCYTAQPDGYMVQLYLRGRACRACIHDDTEDYAYMSDVQMWALREDAFKHSDGYCYSYPENNADNLRVIRAEVLPYDANVFDYFLYPPKVSPTEDILMGVELEVVPYEGTHDDNVRLCHDHFHKHAILKYDGSISTDATDEDEYDNGFEIVTKPMNLSEHLELFGNWRQSGSLVAWDVGVCGMHVHIGRSSFTPEELGRFVEFYNSHKTRDLVRKVAGRYNNEFAMTEEYYVGEPLRTIKDKSPSKYHMVRFKGEEGLINSTVEVRAFKATLHKPRLLAQLEFTHASVMFCRHVGDKDIKEQAFHKWLDDRYGYDHLKAFLA